MADSVNRVKKLPYIFNWAVDAPFQLFNVAAAVYTSEYLKRAHGQVKKVPKSPDSRIYHPPYTDALLPKFGNNNSPAKESDTQVPVESQETTAAPLDSTTATTTDSSEKSNKRKLISDYYISKKIKMASQNQQPMDTNAEGSEGGFARLMGLNMVVDHLKLQHLQITMKLCFIVIFVII